MIAILAPSPGGEKGPHLVLRDSEARGIINTLNSTLVSASLAPHAETLCKFKTILKQNINFLKRLLRKFSITREIAFM